MTTKVSKSYEYNVICDVCGFKIKSYESRKRWDGLIVCDKDWEQRHVLDFYRTKNDVHNLPFTRPDAQTELSWTPVFTGFTQTAGTGTITISATYKQDSINSKIFFTVTIAITGNATTASGPATMSVPVTVAIAGTLHVIDSQGVQYGATGGTIPAAGTTALLPVWGAANRNITITGSYGY